MALPHQCVWCGDDLAPSQLKAGRKYCSRTCVAEAQRRDTSGVKVSTPQRAPAKSPRRFIDCANCGKSVRTQANKYCSRRCYVEARTTGSLAKREALKADAEAIMARVALVGYKTAAAELGLTKNTLLNRMYRLGYRCKADWLDRCQRGLHNTHKIHAEQAQNAVD